MSKTNLFLLLLSAILLFSPNVYSQSQNFVSSRSSRFVETTNARNIVKAAMEAMGGEAKLREVKNVRYEAIGHSLMIEQSERPEGPWIPIYTQIIETRDFAGKRLRSTAKTRFFQIPEWSETNSIVSGGVAALERGGKLFPNNPTQVQTASKNLALAPERVLLNAFDAPDLRIEKETVLQGVTQKVVRFTWNQMPVAIYLNADTNLPTAVETLESSPYDHFYSVWGDFTHRTYYSLWTLEKGGVRYPRQWDAERLGKTLSSLTITKIEFNRNLSEEDFAIADDLKTKFAKIPLTKIADLPLGLPNKPAKEFASGIVKIPGRWDVAIVKQSDGIVIVEAPISSNYSVKVLEEARRRFPDSRIKAVITTSDAFPHIGGVREYAAQNVPIYALDLNRPILEKLLSAPHTFEPDNLQKNKRRPNFKFVSNKTVVGEGANRLEIYPIRSESGERMVMIYFPEHKLLYASDLIQKQANGSFFMPQYLTEIMQAVAREKLDVQSVFAMHTDFTPWQEVSDAVRKETAEN